MTYNSLYTIDRGCLSNMEVWCIIKIFNNVVGFGEIRKQEIKLECRIYIIYE